jgi:hypothetical protein
MAEFNDNQISADQKPQSKLIQALQIVFGRSPRQLDIAKGKELPQERYGSFDSIENRLSKIFTGYTDIQYDRMTKYRDYDRMDSASTECQVGLDIYAEEASQKDDKTGLRVWIESEQEAVSQDLNGMLQRTRTEFKAYGLYRNLGKYGDCFVYVMPGGYGVHDYQFVHPSRIERVQQDGLIGFKSPELASHLASDNKVGMFKAWDFIHMRITAYDQESVYGRSFLEPIRKVYKQLSMLETMLVLYRIAKAVQRNIFYVDVGQASVAETTNLVKDYERFLKNKQQFIDPKTNEFKLEFNPATILQDIVWPVRPGSLSKVDQLQNTSSIGPLEDVDHFRNKIRTGLNIPKDYFDGESTGAWNSREALMLQDVRFGRKITKLQDGMREGIIKLCQIHWAISKGEYLPPDAFSVQLGTISSTADRQREDILLRKAQILEILANIAVTMGWNRWAWGDYLLDEIFPLPAKLRAKLQTPDPVIQQEFEKQKELSSQGPGGKGGGGSLKGIKPNKPPKKTTADSVKKGLRSFGYGENVLATVTNLIEEFKDLEVAEEKLKSPIAIAEANMWGFSKDELATLIASRHEVVKTLADSKIDYKQLHEMNKPPEQTINKRDALSIVDELEEEFLDA